MSSLRSFGAFVCFGFGAVLCLSAIPAFVGLAGLGTTTGPELAQAIIALVSGWAFILLGTKVGPKPAT